jgi:hypothetical protein
MSEPIYAGTRYDPRPIEPNRSGEPIEVTVVDVRVNFWSLVTFLVKLSFAAIPAAIIIVGVWLVLGAFFGGMLAALTGHHHGR